MARHPTIRTPEQLARRLTHRRQVRNEQNRRYRKAHLQQVKRKEMRARRKTRTGTFTAQSSLGRRTAAQLKRVGLSIITKASLTRPPLAYIDAQGRVWREDLRSAEQLIQDWQLEQKKKGHRR